MRIAQPGLVENLTGKICVCSTGRVAIVTGTKDFKWGKSYVGLGLDGKGTWASTQPCILDDDSQTFHDKLVERFNGKMSFNG